MAKDDDKKYFWIKLHTDFFTRGTIDFLMAQKNGSNYVVLYQMLCLSTANTNGSLITVVGENIVKYDVDKIVRDTKYFDRDTVIVALELYRKLNLIYEETDGNLQIANYEEMVGFITGGALRKAKEREQKELGDNSGTNVPKSLESRDKSIKTKYKEEIKENIKEKKVASSTHFIVPTIEEIEGYCKERNNNVNASKFHAFYESKGWLVGKTKMKDWKACVRTWEQGEQNGKPKSALPKYKTTSQRGLTSKSDF